MTLQEIVEDAQRIVFFGGAGVSTESGIPDFRSKDGLYSQKVAYPPEEILSHRFFYQHTALFFEFYRTRMLCPHAQPNAAHYKLADLERSGKLTHVITQNIDGLHQKAGSRQVLELHGSVLRNYCQNCGRFFDLQFMLQAQGIPKCACGGLVKPDVVLYGESLHTATVEAAIDAIAQADCLLVAGTSLSVYPAAGFIQYFSGRHFVLINRDPTPADRMASLVLREPVGQVLSGLV